MRHLIAFILAASLLFAPALAGAPLEPAAPDGPSLVPVTRGQFVQILWEQWGGVPYADTFYFSDVGHNEPYTAAICWAHDLGLVLGTGDAGFEPDRPITREEAAVFLRRCAAHVGKQTATISNVAECNDYADISPWADDSLYWATERGLIGWAEGGLRAPLGTITPEEASAIFQYFALM